MTIAIICGSPRPQANSLRVAALAEKTLASIGVETERIDLTGNPLPLWHEGIPRGEGAGADAWASVASTLQRCDAVVLACPEYNGMAPPGVMNFLLCCSNAEIGYKPALLLPVSAGRGGSYPNAELRVFGIKNNHLVWIPETVIFAPVQDLIDAEGNPTEAGGAQAERLRYALTILADLAGRFAAFREQGLHDFKKYGNGM